MHYIILLIVALKIYVPAIAEVHFSHSLFITSPQVLDDPRSLSQLDNPTCQGENCGLGPWSFGGIMTQMAGENNPSDFTEKFLKNWLTSKKVNELPWPARAGVKSVIDSWCKDEKGKLKLALAPFRLLAIVNRLDKRTPGNAGEGRFVFELLSTNGDCKDNHIPLVTGTMGFWVIIEFKQPLNLDTDQTSLLTECNDLQKLTEDWAKLSDLTPDQNEYKTQLEILTNRFSKKIPSNISIKANLNQSFLKQIRTNDIAFGNWEIREFNLKADPNKPNLALLNPTTTKKTPVESLRTNELLLRDYVLENADAILTNTHQVPEIYQEIRMLSPTAPLTGPWKIDGVAPELRHQFSLNTCSGCHSFETATSFTHVGLRNLGQPAPLSSYISGVNVPDPFDSRITHEFNESKVRLNDMDKILTTSCANKDIAWNTLTGVNANSTH